MVSLPTRVGKALVDFSSSFEFPDAEDISAAPVEGTVITAAYRALSDAKETLETEIRTLSRESAPDVETWIATAKALQKDIQLSRALANKVVKQAEEDHSGDEIELQELHVGFLEKELQFNSQLRDALVSVKEVEECLRRADQLATDRKIIESLQLLADSEEKLGEISVLATTRLHHLLRAKYDAKRESIHGDFMFSWRKLVSIDPAGVFTINQTTHGESMSLGDAVTALRDYKELDQAAIRLWEDLDNAVIKPRTQMPPVHSIEFRDNGISISQAAPDDTIEALIRDVEGIATVLTANLPDDFVKPFSKAMMPPLMSRVRELWLDRAIPSSLEDMEQYKSSLSQVHELADKIDALHWPGSEALHDWGKNAPRIWLNKRKETELDKTRNQLAVGVGKMHLAEHVEVHEVSQKVSEDIAAAAGPGATEEWDAAWDSDEGESSSLKNGGGAAPTAGIQKPTEGNGGDAVDDDAWGWGDEPSDSAEEPQPEEKQLEEPRDMEQGRNHAVTLKESYWTSSMPKPVYDTITDIYLDGVKLAQSENTPIALATNGLFGLPTQVLALYRAVSKQYYAENPSGNMLLYNDCIWLCDRLSEYVLQWEAKDDLPPRIQNLLKLAPEIVKLRNFGKRAYKEELTSQRTTINDLLGGTQNLLQSNRPEDLERMIDSVVTHIRNMATQWKAILPYSVLASALGSLVNKIASKIIYDVLDLQSLNADAAENTAKLISNVETLDDLFNKAETPKFADQWMKMKFLSEVLQSNLQDIRMLWFESDLGLYFTKDEVLDLIQLSFEDNVKSKQLKREIRDSMVQ